MPEREQRLESSLPEIRLLAPSPGGSSLWTARVQSTHIAHPRSPLSRRAGCLYSRTPIPRTVPRPTAPSSSTSLVSVSPIFVDDGAAQGTHKGIKEAPGKRLPPSALTTLLRPVERSVNSVALRVRGDAVGGEATLVSLTGGATGRWLPFAEQKSQPLHLHIVQWNLAALTRQKGSHIVTVASPFFAGVQGAPRAGGADAPGSLSVT